MQILIATSNPGKRKEILSAIFPLEGVEFVSLDELGITSDVEETGESYGDNALIKARHFFAESRLPTLAEDSGIEVSALQGELGVKTRRWGAGPQASDEEWLEHFMNRLTGEEDRSARFISHVVYLDESGHQAFEGECPGTITRGIEGPISAGIPISAVFQPVGEELVYSAMDEEHKNSLSHRGHAVKQMKEWLQDYLANRPHD